MKRDLINEVRQLQKIAGLIKEDDYTDDKATIPSGDTDPMNIGENISMNDSLNPEKLADYVVKTRRKDLEKWFNEVPEERAKKWIETYGFMAIKGAEGNAGNAELNAKNLINDEDFMNDYMNAVMSKLGLDTVEEGGIDDLGDYLAEDGDESIHSAASEHGLYRALTSLMQAGFSKEDILDYINDEF